MGQVLNNFGLPNKCINTLVINAYYSMKNTDLNSTSNYKRYGDKRD